MTLLHPASYTNKIDWRPTQYGIPPPPWDVPGSQVARGGGYAAALLTLGWLLWPCLQTSQKLVEMDDPKHMKQIIQMCCQGVKEVSIARMEEMKLLACLTSLGSDTTTLVQRSSPRSPHFLCIYIWSNGSAECICKLCIYVYCLQPDAGRGQCGSARVVIS